MPTSALCLVDLTQIMWVQNRVRIINSNCVLKPILHCFQITQYSVCHFTIRGHALNQSLLCSTTVKPVLCQINSMQSVFGWNIIHGWNNMQSVNGWNGHALIWPRYQSSHPDSRGSRTQIVHWSLQSWQEIPVLKVHTSADYHWNSRWYAVGGE